MHFIANMIDDYEFNYLMNILSNTKLIFNINMPNHVLTIIIDFMQAIVCVDYNDKNININTDKSLMPEMDNIKLTLTW